MAGGFDSCCFLGRLGLTAESFREAEGLLMLCLPAVITGQQRSGVVSARTRLEVLLDSFRRRQPFTHFLSLPLNQPAIQQNFLHFKEEVLHKCSKVGIHMRVTVLFRFLAFFLKIFLPVLFPRNAFLIGLLLKLVGLLVNLLSAVVKFSEKWNGLLRYSPI